MNVFSVCCWIVLLFWISVDFLFKKSWANYKFCVCVRSRVHLFVCPSVTFYTLPCTKYEHTIKTVFFLNHCLIIFRCSWITLFIINSLEKCQSCLRYILSNNIFHLKNPSGGNIIFVLDRLLRRLIMFLMNIGVKRESNAFFIKGFGARLHFSQFFDVVPCVFFFTTELMWRNTYKWLTQ